MGRMRLTSLNVYGPIAKQRELVRAASNWCDNTASQNMFLNIFFLHPTMHRGALLNSWDFHAFYALWFGHCGLNHRRCRHRRGGRPSRILTFRTGRGGAVTLPAPLLEETHPVF